MHRDGSKFTESPVLEHAATPNALSRFCPLSASVSLFLFIIFLTVIELLLIRSIEGTDPIRGRRKYDRMDRAAA